MRAKGKISIRKNGQRPDLEWMVSIPRSMNGGKRTTRSFPTKPEAISFRDSFSGVVLAGGIKKALDSGETFRAVWSDYSDTVTAKRSARHRETLAYFGPKFLDAFGPAPIAAVTVLDIERWLRKQQRKWSERTVFNAFSCLRSFLRWAHLRKIIPENPAEALSSEIRKPVSPKVIITAAEMRILLHCTKRDPVLRAYVVLGGFAGIRTKEIQCLKWENLNFEEEEIYVPPEAIKKTEARGGLRERYVKMIPAFLANIPRVKEGPIIPWTRRPFEYKRQDIRKRAIKIMRRIGLPVEKWDSWPDNCLRHTFASCLLATKKDAWAVAHELGHTNTKTLHRDYARAVREREAKAYLALGVSP